MESQFVNNEIYQELGERWYKAKDDPIALLRAESRARNPWIVAAIHQHFGTAAAHVLDVGCGAGFLSNDLAQQGFQVSGLDASENSLAVARRYDITGSVKYQTGDAHRMPYADASFEVACAMDFLEHIEAPHQVIAEIARVLKPGGLFFFHTFNRNIVAWLVIIKGVEWFVKNVPRDLHVLQLFIKPEELQLMCERQRLHVETLRGFAPKIMQKAFWRMLLKGVVTDDFAFHFTNSTLTGYTGCAVKR
ncbi:MAG: 3-demethylubiquinone-9 3-O-methyltransferase [Acidobacteria bacterium]|nr:3-demethylubiquinone-9 3-O-methyltransferase [Acidobacteriota bacterium]